MIEPSRFCIRLVALGTGRAMEALEQDHLSQSLFLRDPDSDAGARFKRLGRRERARCMLS